MKKIRGDKPIGVIIHMYMEISQGSSLSSYLYLKQANMSCFLFYLFSFLFYKIREQDCPVGRADTYGSGGGDEERGQDGEYGAIECVHI
jgi:hypothetical protein